MISVEGLKVEFNATPLFEDVSYVINKKDRIALVGKNGAGKSTMLKILAGLQQPTAGTVAVPRDCTIGYLPQVMKLADSRTVMQEAEQAFAHIHELQADIERINRELAERTDYESDDYQKLIERFTHLNDRFLMMGGTNYQAEIERTLQGLGFERADFDRPTSEFSGGWRMRIELAKLLLQRPDVLLLDEPTNHLDIESIQWLEQFLATRANAVVLVSHDRAFLNNVTTRTIEISCGHIYDYKVKYDDFVRLRKERREQQLRAYENQQKQIEDTEAFIERFRYKATKAVQVQSRIKQLAKLERIEVDEEDTSALRLKFTCSSRSGNYPVICENVAKAYGDHVVFHDVNLTINRGEKVAFVGKNGEGKSTLVKCIMGEITDYTGRLTLGMRSPDGGEFRLLSDENFAPAPPVKPMELTGRDGKRYPLVMRRNRFLLFTGKQERKVLEEFRFLTPVEELDFRCAERSGKAAELPPVLVLPDEADRQFSLAFRDEPENAVTVRPVSYAEDLVPLRPDLRLDLWLPRFLYDTEILEGTIELGSRLPLAVETELSIRPEFPDRGFSERLIPVTLPAKSDERFDRFSQDVIRKFPLPLPGERIGESQSLTIGLSLFGFEFDRREIRFLRAADARGLIATPEGIQDRQGRRIVLLLHRPTLAELRNWELPRKLSHEFLTWL